MPSVAKSSRSGRRLNASGRARRAKRAATRRNRLILGSALALAVVVSAPVALVTKMGAVPTMPGLDSAKSFLAMISDRSPGDRTKAELTKTKKKAAATAAGPKQRALPKIAKPELPKEFVDAIAPPPPAIAEIASIAPKDAIGPALLAPPIPGGGGGIVIPPQAPPPGGGGGTPTPNSPPETPPNTPPNQPPPPPAVPEPGTWATMLLGFGLSGMMIRRRRRILAAAVSG